MSRFVRNPLVYMLILVLALAVGGAVTLAQGDSKIKNASKVRVVVVDDDGNRHEEKFEFDSDNPRPFLGVTLQGDDDGVRVLHVAKGSGAEAAGLLKGDVIVGIEGDDVNDPWDLTHKVLRGKPGDLVDVEIVRDGERQTVTAELGQRMGNMQFEFDFDWDSEAFENQMEQLEGRLEGLNFEFDSDAFQEQMEQLHEHLGELDLHGNGRHGSWVFRHGSRPKLGVELVDSTPELREHLGGSADEGVLVGKVMDDMPAADAGIEVGDLIVEVGGDSIGSVGDLRRALGEADGRTEITVIRDGRSVQLDALIEQDDDKAQGSSRHRHERRHRVRSAQDRS